MQGHVRAGATGARPAEPDTCGGSIQIDEFDVTVIQAEERPDSVQNDFDILAREFHADIMRVSVSKACAEKHSGRPGACTSRNSIGE